MHLLRMQISRELLDKLSFWFFNLLPYTENQPEFILPTVPIRLKITISHILCDWYINPISFLPIYTKYGLSVFTLKTPMVVTDGKRSE